MGREDEERFHQRQNEHRDHDYRDHAHHFAEETAYEQQWRERRDSCQAGEDDCFSHLPRTVHRSHVESFSEFPPVYIDILPDNDSIINHDSENYQEREEAHHVY
ncbi:hypothetical protein BMS3Bbin04_00800 [bacterium BMS3Bbin04]|nr:hypothetical protein BMS3Bbin04_00800 [bacterium BMS3Bbin04]